MFLECINMVLKIWESDPPYDLEGEFFNITTGRTMIPEIGQGAIMRPYQDPHPPIVGTVVAPFSKGVTAMAAQRLGADICELSVTEMGRHPLAELCRGLRPGGPSREHRELARGQEYLRRQGR